jgi:plasmid maintenance system antidote protein VapI
MDTGQAIRVGLAIKNNNQRWLAKELSITAAHVSRLCNGTKKPGADMQERLLEVFKCKLSVFALWGEL